METVGIVFEETWHLNSLTKVKGSLLFAQWHLVNSVPLFELALGFSVRYWMAAGDMVIEARDGVSDDSSG